MIKSQNKSQIKSQLLLIITLAFTTALSISNLADATVVQHAPFAKGTCVACHKTSPDGKPISDAFVADQPTMCYQCHEHKDKGPVVHAALAMGDCTTCHAPHESQIRPLLKDKVENTCTQCHDAPGQDLPVKHSALNMTKSCVRCHNAHSSENEKLLKAETTQLCTYCHTSVAKGIDNPVNTVHPAALMGCQNCHAPHGSKYKKLLKDAPNNLCLTCHDPAFADGHPRKGHPTSGKPDPIYPEKEMSCLSCHKPHYSANEKLQRYNFKKAPYDGKICSVCHWKQLLPPPGPPRPGWDD